MPVVARVVTVGTTPTLLAQGISNNDPMQVIVRNDSGVTVYFGGPDVTTVQGLSCPTGEERQWFLGLSDALYGIVSTGTALVQVGRTRA